MLKDVNWVNPPHDAGSPLDVPRQLTNYFSKEAVKEMNYLPELDLIPFDGDIGVSREAEGFLVAFAPPSQEEVLVGDVITHIDGLCPVLLAVDRKELLSSVEVEEGAQAERCSLSTEAVRKWGQNKRIPKNKLESIVNQLDPENLGRVDTEALCASLSEELAKVLFGQYKSEAKLTLWRPTGTISCLCMRTRDARQQTVVPTPER